MNTPKEYSRTMGNMRGIDATSDASNVSPRRFSFIQNMYKDYKSGQGVAIETFPGTRVLKNFNEPAKANKIHGIHHFKGTNGATYVVIHVGERLYITRINSDGSFSGVYEKIYDAMNERKSTSFVRNNKLYVLDGKNYLEVSASGTAKRIVAIEDKGEEENVTEAYIPTTYSDGAQYEQRNMLTNRFREKTHLISIEESRVNLFDFIKTGICYTYNGHDRYNTTYAPGTTGWWRVVFAGEKGYIDSLVNCVYMDFGYNVRYEDGVLIIGSINDARNQVTSRHFSDNVTEIKGNFNGCTMLTELTLPDGVATLEDGFFAGTALTEIRLPRALTSLGEGAFSGCNSLTTIYASDKPFISSKDGMTSMYALLTNNRNGYGVPSSTEIKPLEDATDRVKETEVEDKENIKNRIYVYTSCKDILDVELDGKVIKPLQEVPQEWTKDNDYYYSKIYKTIGENIYIVAIDIHGKQSDIAHDVYIRGEAHPNNFSSAAEAFIENRPLADFEDKSIYANHDFSKSTKDAINNCTITCTFDDRIFFTGNPDLPNTVFYTQRDLTGHTNPSYIGALNWFDDGMGAEPNTAMMSNATTLMVLKGNTIQDGSIYYHVGADGGNDITPRIYPSTEGLAGLGCVGLAVNFRDDCCFLSKQGLEAVSKQAVNLERTIAHRSTNIDGLLLQCNLANARAAEWEGYLCILIDGQMFLADSRQMFEGIGGAIEYEWYYVNPVGGYTGDMTKYYYTDSVPQELWDMLNKLKEDGGANYEYFINDDADKKPDNEKVHTETVSYSKVIEDYTIYLVDEDGNETPYDNYDAFGSSHDGKTLKLVLNNLSEDPTAYEAILYVGLAEGGYGAPNVRFDENGIATCKLDFSSDVNYYKVDVVIYKPFGNRTYNIAYEEKPSGKKYFVDQNIYRVNGVEISERDGGDIDKACEICAIDDILLFGTENGQILCLNTDKRGTDDNEPDKSRIPMQYYNNSGHAYYAVAVFAMENAGVPHYTKTTVKRGTVLRLKSFPASSFEVYATTDRQSTTLLTKQSNSITTFDELDFANLGLLTNDSGILAIKEKTKKWVEKQYMIIGKEFNHPWGFHSLTYRYTIQGEVKNK